MNKKIFIILIFLLSIICGLLIYLVFNRNNKNFTENITVVPTMSDKITNDSSWCGTFQLVFNDMKNEVVKQDIIFTPQEDMVINLNKEEFREDMISDSYYYKIYGIKKKELKKQIEDAILEKFNQKSDILDDFDFSDSDNDKDNFNNYFFYTMLYREFNFLNKFDKLEDGDFGEYKNIKYFGINDNTDNIVGDQIDVLFYNSKDDFAILINTKENDEIIFYKNPKGNTFNEIYDNLNKKSQDFDGDSKFNDNDEFKAPIIDFNVKKEYEELENKPFKTLGYDFDNAVISKAIQTISFSIDEKGGKIKSEAGLDIKFTSLENGEKRYFYLDDTFAIFLREKNKEIPYFASKINDITKYQVK